MYPSSFSGLKEAFSSGGHRSYQTHANSPQVCNTRSESPVTCFKIGQQWLINLSHLDCLAKNSYNEAKCRSQVDALYDCCNAFYEKFGENAQSASCPKPNLLRLKIKQRAEESSRK